MAAGGTVVFQRWFFDNPYQQTVVRLAEKTTEGGMKIRDLFLFSLAIILAFFIYSKPDNREKTFTLIAKISAVGKPYRFGTEEIVGLFLEEVQSPSDEFFWIGRLLIKRRGVIFSDNWRVWPVTVIPPALIGKDIVISAGTSPIIRIKKIRLL